MASATYSTQPTPPTPPIPPHTAHKYNSSALTVLHKNLKAGFSPRQKKRGQGHEHEALGDVVKDQGSSFIELPQNAVVGQARNGWCCNPHPHARPVPVVCIGCCDCSLESHGEEDYPHDQGKAKSAKDHIITPARNMGESSVFSQHMQNIGYQLLYHGVWTASSEA